MTPSPVGRSGAGVAIGDGGAASHRSGGPWVGAALAVARRPELWATGVRQAVSLARPGWWRTWPPLPAPPDDYLRFRLQTVYGGEGADPAPDDLVTYLRWCRQWRRLVRSARRR